MVIDNSNQNAMKNNAKKPASFRKEPFHKIAYSTRGVLEVANIGDIILCEAQNNYTKISFQKKAVLLCKSLKQVAKALQPYNFYRVHRHYLVNLNHVSRYNTKDGRVALPGDRLIKLSLRNRKGFLAALHQVL